MQIIALGSSSLLPGVMFPSLRDFHTLTCLKTCSYLFEAHDQDIPDCESLHNSVLFAL